MSRRNKEKETFIEEGMEFTSLEHAKQVAEKEGKKLKFKLICAGISLITTIVWLLYWFAGIEGTVMEEILGVPLVIGVVAMFVCTNISYFKYLWKSIVVAWFLIPIFPIDVLMCIMGAAVFFIFSIYFPIVPCIMAIRQSYQNKQEADSYIFMAEGCANIPAEQF